MLSFNALTGCCQRLRARASAAFAAWPAPVRVLSGGTALLAAILVGGALTAYGGLLLVVLLWALCTGWLWWLLAYAWRVAFPGERLRSDPAFLRSLLAGAAVGVAVIAALVLYRQTLYSEDAINYYSKQSLLFNTFAANGFYGVRTLLENLLAADYKMFMNLFISLPYLLLPRTVNAFMLSYALTCFVPAWAALLMLARKLAGCFPGVRRGLFYAVCMAAMALWPMFLWPATHGMPDAFGLTFAAVILLLAGSLNFETLPPARLLALFGATFALILTRRWYMFWVLAFYLLYAAALLVRAARRGCAVRVFGNLCKFGLPSVAVTLLALLPTFRTILSTDYADIYGAYYGGGFLVNCAAQAGRQGWVWLALCAVGLAVLLRRKAARGPAAVTVLASLLAMLLFTHTQSLGDHQSLLLAPAYLVCLFGCAAAVCALPRRAVARGGAAALCAFFLLNCANALRVPGANVQTPLLSDESLDITRRTDLDAMRAVTGFVLANCAPDETVYLNINSDGYNGTTFAYSDPSHPELQSMILWECSVPSTHGFPTGIWSSRYVMVTDKTDAGNLIGPINAAIRGDSPAAAHYAYVTEFPLANGVTLYCYERISPPDAAEASYFKQLFAEYDAQWPALYSERIDAYLAAQGTN